jgi:hypothetical protein
MTHESRPSSTIDSFFPPKNEPRGPKPSKPLFTSYEGAAHLFTHTAALETQSSALALPLHNKPAPPIEPIHNPSPTDVFTRLQELGVVFDGDIHTGYLSDMSDPEDDLFEGEDGMSHDEDGEYGEDTLTESKEAPKRKRH